VERQHVGRFAVNNWQRSGRRNLLLVNHHEEPFLQDQDPAVSIVPQLPKRRPICL
jgi:hypothetical protein